MNAMRTIRKLKMWKCIQAAMKATAAAAIIAASTDASRHAGVVCRHQGFQQRGAAQRFARPCP